MSSAFELGFGTSQEMAVDTLPVQGTLPDWLSGTLVRNGPGTFQVGEQRYRHWFDGLAMLHKFSFGGGRVSYANKYLDTDAYRAAQESGKISYSEFATDPCRSLFGRVMALFSPKITDSAKVSVAKIADRFMALAETPIQVEFDPDTLASVGVFNYEPSLTGQMTTVHPQFDFARDEVFNVVTRFNRVSHYNIYKMNGSSLQPHRAGAVATKQPSYMHSFGMTQNYIILTEFPLVVNPLSLLLWLRPYIENFRWQPERGTPFWVVNRHTGQVVGRFECDPFFAFHHVNAFERGDELVVDLASYPDAGIIDAWYLERMASESHQLPFGQLRRYTVNLKNGQVSFETLSDECIELPRFDYDRLNMDGSYRYVYGVSIDRQRRSWFYNQLIKIDVQSGQSRTWREDNCYPGEPIFVGAPGRTTEDEGIVLSVVLDAGQETSFLLALNAQSFEEVARAQIPQPVLFGYHGAYFEINRNQELGVRN